MRSYFRGSSLLLGGRLLSVLMNFAVQVLTVRYLAKEDYGAFAFALSVVSVVAGTILLGMGKAIPRMVPVYQERDDYPRAFGAIAVAATTVWTLGLVCVLALHTFSAFVGRAMVTDRASLSILLVLIALAPLDAFDTLLQQLAAIFSGPRAIFLRRQVVGPAFKLTTVLAVTYLEGGVSMLAYGYLLGSLTGVAMYVASVVGAWQRDRVLDRLRDQPLTFPFREVISFSLPLLASDIALLLRGSIAVLLLAYLRSPAEVAEYRAVFPVAGLNMLVFDALALTFVPVASRLFARQDQRGLGHLYWRTSLWIAVLTYPVFAVTFVMAQPLTVWLFGAEYAGAALELAILAVGYYVNAAVGFNAATLRVHGHVKTLAAINVVSGLACVLLGLVLVRRFGAIGAAVGTTATLVLQNVLNHAGLWWHQAAVPLATRAFVRSYLAILAGVAALGTGAYLLEPPPPLLLAAVALSSILVFRCSHRALEIAGTFPELMRVPLLRRFIA